MNSESSPLVLTILVNTPSAAGLLQMLPKHTKRTEKGLVFVEAASDEDDDDALISKDLKLIAPLVGFF